MGMKVQGASLASLPAQSWEAYSRWLNPSSWRGSPDNFLSAASIATRAVAMHESPGARTLLLWAPQIAALLDGRDLADAISYIFTGFSNLTVPEALPFRTEALTSTSNRCVEESSCAEILAPHVDTPSPLVAAMLGHFPGAFLQFAEKVKVSMET